MAEALNSGKARPFRTLNTILMLKILGKTAQTSVITVAETKKLLVIG